MILNGMSGASFGAYLGHHLGHVWGISEASSGDHLGIIWGIISDMSGACLRHHPKACLGHSKMSAVQHTYLLPFFFLSPECLSEASPG